MKATLISFAYRSGAHIVRADAWIDARSIRNPWSVPRLRNLTGLSPEVQAFVTADPQCDVVLRAARAALKDGSRIAIGCWGGKHRSVVVAEELARQLRAEGWTLTLLHRELVGAACN